MLEYDLKHGHKEKQLIKIAQQNKTPIPEFIQNAPVLQPFLVWIYEAFGLLSTCRETGWSIGQIPWTAINDYCLRYNIAGDEYEEFCLYIIQMDTFYVKHFSDKKNEKSK